MTNYNVTLIDSHDCTVAGNFTLEAIDRADAEVRLNVLYGDTTYLQVDEIVHVDDI